jgi:hypothetical protein
MKKHEFKKLTKREKQILIWTILGGVGLIIFALIVKGGF